MIGGPPGRVEHAVGEIDEAAVEVAAAIPQEAPDDGEGLLEPRYPPVEGEAEGGVLPFVPACPEAEDEATTGDAVDGGGHLGEHGRRVKARGGDEGSQLDALGDRGECGE